MAVVTWLLLVPVEIFSGWATWKLTMGKAEKVVDDESAEQLQGLLKIARKMEKAIGKVMTRLDKVDERIETISEILVAQEARIAELESKPVRRTR